MKGFKVLVTSEVYVSIDETKWSDENLKSWAEVFYPFEDLSEHAKHIAQLAVRGLASDDQFVEGYGELKDSGISVQIDDSYQEIEHEK